MDGILERLKPKEWLYLITMFFFILGCLTLPRSMSAPLLFLKNIKPGAIEFINTMGLMGDVGLAAFAVGLWIAMLAILSMSINIKLKEIMILIGVSAVIGFFLIGVPGLFALCFLYYCKETRDFSEKMKHADPRIASAVAMTTTFVLVGLLGSIGAMRGELYFEPKNLEFTQGFGKAWFGCETDITVENCIEQTAGQKIGYNLLIQQCGALGTAEARNSCIDRVNVTRKDAITALTTQFEQMGDIKHTVGEFTTIVLAQQLNTWAGQMPQESKFILGLMMFSLLTLVGFLLELVVPQLSYVMLKLLEEFRFIYPYKKMEESEYYVVLE